MTSNPLPTTSSSSSDAVSVGISGGAPVVVKTQNALQALMTGAMMISAKDKKKNEAEAVSAASKAAAEQIGAAASAAVAARHAAKFLKLPK